ncbi:MAG: GHKL domain-containing protein [Clostridium sp.]|nr:GHKL domain-containing protein [Clostridium sp.]
MEIFNRKRKYKNRIVPASVLAGLILLYYLASCILYNYLWMKQIAIVLLLSIAMHLLFENSCIKSTVLAMIYQGLVLITDCVMLLVVGKIFPSLSIEILETSTVTISISLVCKMMLLCVVLLLKRKIGHKQGDMLTDMEWLRLLTVPIITMISVIAMDLKFNISRDIRQDDTLMYIALGMAGMNIIVFYLINDIMEREQIIRKDILFREKVKNEMDMYYAVSENLDRQRKRTHEFKNQIACIASLADSEKYAELKDYIRKIDSNLKLHMDMVDTNNVIVNAILNTKYKEALEKQIVFVLKVNDLSEMVLPDEDIVVILSNLLNNAIEACVACEKKVLKLKLVLEENELVISVKNSMQKIPIKENGKFVTGKTKEPEEHGVGIGNIIQTIEKHGGKYAIEYDEDIFSFTIMIPNGK